MKWTADDEALIYADEHSEPRLVLKQSMEAGPPKEIADLVEDELFDFGYSLDGTSLDMARLWPSLAATISTTSS